MSSDRPTDNAPAELRFFDRHAGELVGSSALSALAFLLLVAVTIHLYRASKARNPELPSAIGVVGPAGAIALAATGLARSIYLAVASADFAGREFQSIESAEDLLKGPLVVAAAALGVAGTLALGFWFVIGSLNAMRLGLLTRAMGIVGVIIGPALVIGLAPFLVTFWLVALGALFLGFWPGGPPPAWITGEAVPWPSARERTAEQVEQTEGSRNGDVEAVGPGVRKPGANARASGGGAHRRKRKRGR